MQCLIDLVTKDLPKNIAIDGELKLVGVPAAESKQIFRSKLDEKEERWPNCCCWR